MKVQSHLFYFNPSKKTDALHFANIPDTSNKNMTSASTSPTTTKAIGKLSEGLEETDTTVLAISSKLFDLNREYEALRTL
ncbi:MAG: hypothetical protein R2788_26695 [Saprospiraceae bacterium]